MNNKIGILINTIFFGGVAAFFRSYGEMHISILHYIGLNDVPIIPTAMNFHEISLIIEHKSNKLLAILFL